MIFAFAECELDTDLRELRREGRPTHLEPQVFDVLLYLIRHRERVVGKDELLDAVWHGRTVSEATLNSRISAARRSIGDSGENQTRLRTISRRGYRFYAEVEERMPAPTAGREVLRGFGEDAPSALRASATRLIGRENDQAAVTKLFRRSRLVTLTGVGGVGKTRLASHIASEVASNYPDGVYLVEFGALGDASAAAHVVAGAVGAVQRPGKTIAQSVVTALSGRRLLLVLDNCEHLIDAIAALVREIMARCPHVTLLATSREALTIEGEQLWSVSPLGIDGTGSPAHQLFLERARAVAPDLALGADDQIVGDICRRLDGIPLAIELAAARIRAMSPVQILDRLDQRFRLLTGGPRGAAERHQTLHRAIQWSYDLLLPLERIVLTRASVFAGGFTLEAAERVCGGADACSSVVDLLDSLARKSLIAVVRSETTLRYGLLETVREFAGQELAISGEDEIARHRHASFFAEESIAYFKIWRSREQLSAYQWLDREMANLRAAFRWSADHGKIDIAAEIASNIGDMARFRMRDEAANWAGEILDAARAVRHRRLAVLLTWAASSAWASGSLEEARRYGEEALLLAGHADVDAFVWAFTDLAVVASYQGDFERAVELARAGAAHGEDRHDRFCLALLLHFLTVAGRIDEAMKIAGGVVAAVEAAGVPSSISAAHRAKGDAFARSNPALALAAYEQAVAVARRSGNYFWENLVVPKLAALQAHHGDPISALRSFGRALGLWRRSSDMVFVSHGLGGLIVLFHRLGRFEAVATLNGALAEGFQSSTFVPELQGIIARARQGMGDMAFGKAAQRGAAMGLRGAVDYAAEEIEQALAALGVSNVTRETGPTL